jgi:tRNA(Ile)-lysidine synthase
MPPLNSTPPPAPSPQGEGAFCGGLIAGIAGIEARAQNRPILVALSGGGDSTALLHVMIEAFGRERLRVCVVDHALRIGSADDAALARERAEALCVEAHVQTLSWPDGSKIGQAAARSARYRALCAAARQTSAKLIVLGHNADDQAETIMMRAESGSSWRGLAGMREIAPAPVWPEGRGLWLARPLLGHRRADLRNFLNEKDAVWIDDPANANPDFARVRMRARLAEMEREGFDPLRLCQEALVHQRHAAALDRDARALIASACAIAKGAATLDPKSWAVAAEDARMRALSVLIAAIAGAEREVSAEAVARLEREIGAPGFSGASLGGAVLKLKKGVVHLARDSGAVLGRADGAAALPPLKLSSGIVSVWDNRLEVRAEAPGWRVLPDDIAAPIFEKADARFTRAEADSAGEIRAQWLTEAHIAHLLPSDSPTKPGAFTPS